MDDCYPCGGPARGGCRSRTPPRRLSPHVSVPRGPDGLADDSGPGLGPIGALGATHAVVVLNPASSSACTSRWTTELQSACLPQGPAHRRPTGRPPLHVSCGSPPVAGVRSSRSLVIATCKRVAVDRDPGDYAGVGKPTRRTRAFTDGPNTRRIAVSTRTCCLTPCHDNCPRSRSIFKCDQVISRRSELT